MGITFFDGQHYRAAVKRCDHCAALVFRKEHYQPLLDLSPRAASTYILNLCEVQSHHSKTVIGNKLSIHFSKVWVWVLGSLNG